MTRRPDGHQPGDTYELIGLLAHSRGDKLSRKQVAWIQDVARREREHHTGPLEDGWIFYEDRGITAKDADRAELRSLRVWPNGSAVRSW